MPDDGGLQHCAFCGRSQEEVGYLVVAQRAAICADCLADATDAIWAAGVPVPRADGGGVGGSTAMVCARGGRARC